MSLNHVIDCGACGTRHDFRIECQQQRERTEMPETKIELQEGESIDEAIMRLAGKAKPKKEPKVTVSDPNSGVPVEQDVYAALHIYQREGEPEGQVRMNGTRERKMHGPNTLVFVHMHSFGAPCTPACRERVAS